MRALREVAFHSAVSAQPLRGPRFVGGDDGETREEGGPGGDDGGAGGIVRADGGMGYPILEMGGAGGIVRVDGGLFE